MGSGFLIAIIAIIAIFVVLPAIVLGNITKWKAMGGLKPGDEHMLEDLWRSARAMERRIETLESILDAEAPGWRGRDRDRSPSSTA